MTMTIHNDEQSKTMIMSQLAVLASGVFVFAVEAVVLSV